MALGAERIFGCVPQRLVLAVMLLLAVVNIYNMKICLSIAIEDMVDTDSGTAEDEESCPQDSSGNSSSSESDQEYDFHWSSGVEGEVLSAFYYGYIVCMVPAGVLADRYSGKHTLGLGILVASITTILLAPAAYLGPGAMMGLRVLSGVGEATTFPAVNVLLAHWIPPEERSRLGTLVFSGAQLGTMFGMGISGVMLEHVHWSWVFYFFGGLGLLWYAFWMVLCHETPADHPSISAAERSYLAAKVPPKQTIPTPWRGILSSVPVWGMSVAQVGHDWGLFSMSTDLPKYMKSVLHFNISSNGLYSALPYLVSWVVAMLSGALADWLLSRGKLSVLTTRKLFTTIAAVVPASLLVGASYAGCERAVVVVLFTLGMAGMGAYYPGVRVNALDLTHHHAGIVMAFGSALSAVSGAVAPTVIGYLTPDNTLSEWRLVFWITFKIFMVSSVVYLFTAQASKQPWDRQHEPHTAPL